MTAPRSGARRGGAGLVRALLVACLAVLALGLAASPASAHATLVSSDPAEGEVLAETPDVVTFTFDEPVSLTADAVQVFDAAGDPVSSEASSRDEVVTADLPDTLDDGTYVVVWRAVSADAHPISGSLTFSIGAPSETVAAPDVGATGGDGAVRAVLSAAQALTYVGLFLAAGLVLFGGWFLGATRVPDAVRARLRRVVRVAAGVAVAAGVVGVPLSGAYQQGLGVGGVVDPAAYDLALVGDDLLVLALQVAGLAAALLLTARRTAATAGAALALLSPALVGHTRAFEPVPLLVATDVVHLVAGAVWLGGLVGLALTLGALSGRGRDAAAVLARFSLAGAVVLGLLVATGSLMAWRILGAWAPLVDTAYGRILLVKIAVAAVVAAIAGWNRWRLLPQVDAAVGHDAQQRATLRVRTSVRCEAALLVVLLGLTGFLTNQSPREESAGARQPVASRVEVARVEGQQVLATLTPGRRGPNTLRLQVQDEAGEPLDGFGAPEVSVSSADVDLGGVPVTPEAAGTYTADVVIPSAGTWEVQISLRASEFENPVTLLEFVVE